ncbi:MAG: polysaccharide deacetylase family protein [Thermoleophilia bacterium]|nr:polysaccharide deacetylase family protein [Thermoleophilia bacterium]
MDDPIRADAERRVARRAAKRRRRARRRAAGIAALAAVAGTAGVAALYARGDDPPEARRHADATVTATGRAADPGTSTTAATTTTPDASAPPGARRDAVARVASVGVPLYRAGGTGRYVALTFDDGPGPYTETTIATLRRYGARATFFVNGTSMQRFPDVLRAEARSGGTVELASHTWAHLYLPGLSPDAAWTQQADTAAYLRRATGRAPTLMRPPYGAHTPDLQRRLNAQGTVMVLWDIDSEDSAGASWDAMLPRLKREIRPGSIVLMHENRGQTQKVVNRLVPYLAKRGWKMVTVSELLALSPPARGSLLREADARAGTRTGISYR